MSIRDPRRDPRPGDVLIKPGCKPRRVTYGPGEWRGWSDCVRYTGGIIEHGCLLRAWRRWARSAEVVATEDITQLAEKENTNA